MFQISAIAIFFILQIIGLGFFLISLIPATIASKRNWFSSFWLGFAGLIGILQIWHFFFAVNWILLALISVLSFIGWIRIHKKGLQSVFSGKIWVWIVVTLVFFMLSNHAIFSQPGYDLGLYHMQTVKWFNQFPIVTGLGNLQHRLAFNSSNYLYAAFMNTSFFQGTGYYTATLILAIMLIMESLSSIKKWLAKDFPITKFTFYEIMLFPIIFWQIGNQPFSGYPADMTIFIVQLVVFGMLLRLWDVTTDEQHFRALFFQILILTAAAITIKLSSAVFGILIIAVIFARGYHCFGKFVFLKRNSLALIGILSFWGIPWLLRNVILSGFLLYPSTILSVAVPWKMPNYLVQDIQTGISTWARTNSGHLNYSADFKWFFLWLKQFVFEARSAFILAVILIVAVLFLSLQKKNRGIQFKDYFPFLLLILVSLAAWFISAPTYRFSGALIWIFLILSILMLIEWVTVNYSSETAWKTSIIMLLFLFFLLPNGLSRDFSFSTVVTAAPETQIAQRNQSLERMEVKTTASGLKVNIPAEGESCWNLPLPCTTPNDFLVGLRLIDPDNMVRGFRISGNQIGGEVFSPFPESFDIDHYFLQAFAQRQGDFQLINDRVLFTMRLSCQN